MQQPTTNDAITVTPAAFAHIKKIFAQQPSSIGVRLAVTEKGCSGKSYQLTFISETQQDDHVYPLGENIVLCVDPKSYFFLSGTEIDYVYQNLKGQFVFHNPHEKASCGCGESFHV